MKERFLPTEELRVWEYNNGEKVYRCFESNGFRVYTHFSERKETIYTSWGPITIPENTLIGSWEFMPLNSSLYRPKRRTIILSKLVKGLSDFFEYIDQPDDSKTIKLGEPEYLYADTNPRMAEFLRRRFGFFNQPYPAKYSDEISVVGLTRLIRKGLTGVKGRTVTDIPLGERMYQRIERQIKDLPSWAGSDAIR